MAQVIQAGKTLKVVGTLTIEFPVPFKKIPVVVVSSYWENQGTAVDKIDTINSISLESFTVVSGNAAGNYYVNWIAVGE